MLLTFITLPQFIQYPPSLPEGLSPPTPNPIQPLTAGQDGAEHLPSRASSPILHLKRTPTKPSVSPPVRRKIAIDSDSEGDDHPLDPGSPFLGATKLAALIGSQASSSGPIPTSSFAQQPTQRVKDRADDTSRVALEMLGMDVMDL